MQDGMPASMEDIMKKLQTSVAFFVLLLVLHALAGHVPARAAGMSIGAQAWYAQWNPAFTNWMTGDLKSFVLGHSFNKKFSMAPEFLYGPSLSFTLTDRVSLSAIMLTGRYKPSASYLKTVNLGGGVTNAYGKSRSSRVQRYDLDTTMSVKAAKYLSFFLGLKYQYYLIKKRTDYVSLDPTSSIIGRMDWDILQNAIGPGLGLSLSFNLVADFYLMASFSGLYMKPLMTIKNNGFRYVPAATSLNPLKKTMTPDYHYAGANSSLTFAYHIRKASLTLSVGFRYQFIYVLGKDARPDAYSLVFGAFDSMFSQKGRWDHFYGATASAVYSFSFEREKSG
jgi:hypothetical protein